MKWANLTQRLLWLPFTVLFVMVITFILMNHAEDHVLIDEIAPESNSTIEHPRKLRNKYIRIVQTKKLDLPSFYFSVVPRAFAYLNQLPDLRERQAKKQWLGQAKSSDVDAFYHKINNYLDTTNQQQNYNHLLSLLYSSPSDANFAVNQLSPQRRNTWTQELNKLQLSKVSIADQIPTFTWHGKSNKFHGFVNKIILLDFGRSEIDGRTVWSKIYSALRWTLPISLLALLLSIGLSYLLSLWALSTKFPWIELLITSKILILFAMPLFWIATLLIVFFTTDYYSQWMNIFPSVGIYSPSPDLSFSQHMIALLSFLFLPVFCMVTSGLAFFYLQWKDNAGEFVKKPFMITAKSKGLSQFNVLKNHILSNASYSILGLTGFFIPSLISGSIIIEVLFNIPGMGRLMFTSINLNDWNIVIAVVFMASIVSFIGFIIADILLQWIHPKNNVFE